MAKEQTNKSSLKAKKNRNRSSKNKTKILQNEIIGIFIVALSIFLIYVTKNDSQSGLMGQSINSFIKSSFGNGFILLPYFILAIGIIRLLNIILKDDTRQITAVIGFFLCFIIYIAITDDNVYKALIGEMKFDKLIDYSIQAGKLNIGGGLVGNILSYVLLRLVGRTGTFIVIGALIFSLFIIVSNQSLIGVFKLFTKYFKNLIKMVYVWIFPDTNSAREKQIKSVEENKTPLELDKDDVKIFDYYSPIEQSIKKSDIISLKMDEFNNSNQNNVEPYQKVLEQKFNEELKNLKKDAVTFNKVEKPIEKPVEKPKEQIVSDEIISISDSDTSDYKLPTVDLLESLQHQTRGDKDELRKEGEKLIDTLNSFNIPCNITQINKGPTITRYEIQPAPGIKVSRITALSNDIALALATSDIRMEAPIPGKAAIGIEVPNRNKTSVFLKSLIESKEYKTSDSKVPFALGKDIAGKNIIASIEKMPHLLIAGATGSGKSVCINSLIMSILYRAKPDEVKLILIDPKVVELSVYNGIPHLLIPVVTDPRKAANALSWAVAEMTNRYKIFAQNSVRDISSYNEKMKKQNGEHMALIVIIIDELADLMTVSSSEVEEYVTRIAQLARACGIHLVIATQRPSVDVITGVIKANIPSRIAFAVSSQIDSRTILDSAGAEKLLGKGDMLYHPMGLPKPIRIQGTFISDDEIKKVVDFIKEQKHEQLLNKREDILSEIEKPKDAGEEIDNFLEQAIEMVVNDGQASASYIQRKFKVGYARAARIIDQMEQRGIVGKSEGSKPRKVLITVEELEKLKNT